MDDIPESLVSEVAEIYTVANTPAYLYKHLITAGLYSRLESWPVQDLLGLYCEIASKEEHSAGEAGVAYCCLIALVENLEDDATVEIRANGFRWVGDIIEIAERRRDSHTELAIRGPRSGFSRERWSTGQAGSGEAREISPGFGRPSVIVED